MRTLSSLRRAVAGRIGLDPFRRKPSRRSRLCALVGILALSGALDAAAQPQQVPLSGEQRQAFGIELARPVAAERTLSRRFPGRVYAGMFGFERRSPFEAAEGAEQAPKVEF